MADKIYKLTTRDNYTRKGLTGETLWTPGKSQTARGLGGLCTDGVIHAYEHPLLAVFFNPIHASIRAPRLWEAEGACLRARDGQAMCGYRTVTLINEVPLPEITTLQRVETAIRCATSLTVTASYRRWAEKWLSGEDRTAKSARAAAEAEAEAAWAAAEAEAEAEAAWAAVEAEAWAAAWAAARSNCFDVLSVIKQVVGEKI